MSRKYSAIPAFNSVLIHLYVYKYFLIYSKKKNLVNQIFTRIVPVVGLEPTRGHPQQILSLPRLPFRHAGNECYFIITISFLQLFLFVSISCFE